MKLNLNGLLDLANEMQLNYVLLYCVCHTQNKKINKCNNLSFLLNEHTFFNKRRLGGLGTRHLTSPQGGTQSIFSPCHTPEHQSLGDLSRHSL